MKQHHIIKAVQQAITELNGLDAAILYGSFARGDASPNSDIDLGLLVNNHFRQEDLIAVLKDVQPSPDHIMPVAMRGKLVAWFHGMHVKLEMAIHRDLTNFGRDLAGSAIPEERLPCAILLDRTGNVLDGVRALQQVGYRPHTIDELVQKFIYEFDNLSTFHRRSDGYRALYFHQIALHCLVQLMNMRANGDRFQFLPRNLLVNITDKDRRRRIYELSGSMYLPDMDKKKRSLLDMFQTTLNELGYPFAEEVGQILERMYERDRYWNLRAVGTHSPLIRWSNLLRSSLPALMETDKLKELIERNTIHTIIDLRAPRELEEHPYSEDALSAVRYVHAPFDPWAQPDWFKEPAYQQGGNQEIAYRFFALGCRESVKSIVEALRSVPAGQGALIHCHAGKDRTGIVCTLIHLLSGAEKEVVFIDYLASESDTYAHNLEIVLKIIENEGGIRKYLINCGVADQDITDLQQRLIHA
jgi:protein tyrosine/serine phosphatase